MTKRLLLIFSFLLLVTVVTNAQWTNLGAWPSAELTGQMHGIAVDPDGKVWAGNFGPERYNLPGTTDTITAGLIRVFNPDGSEASFSPVWGGTLNGVADTNKSNIRGMATDHQGNILMVDGARVMRRFNYQTGALMNRVVLQMTTSPVAPAVAENGNIFVGPVVNAGQPIEEYDANFTFLQNAVDLTLTGFSRAMEVSADGNTIYFPIYTWKRIVVFQRADEFSAFDSVGTIMDGVACESIEWNEATGNLWASGGSYNDLPEVGTPWTPNTWYGYDVANNAVVDSLKWNFTVDASNSERPRAIDFSPDGNTAYIGCFGGSGYPLIQKVIKGEAPAVSVTFEVDMGVQAFKGRFVPGTDQISVAGTFNEWNATATPMTDTDGDTIYTVTVDNFNVGDNIEFKFVKNGADWETIDNRTYTVPGTNSTYTAYWDNDESYVILSPVDVTFSVNMEYEIASGRFVPATDTLTVRGSFNGWGSEDIMTQSVTDPNFYEYTKEYQVGAGDQWGYKFAYTSAGAVVWETGDNYLYTFTQDDISAGTAYIAHQNDEGDERFNARNPLLFQDVTVKFEVDMNGAKDAQNGNAFATIENVIIAGAILPLQWPAGGWPDTDQDKVIFLKDDGTGGDLTSGDNIWTVEVTFGQYSSAIIQYKYGANWGGDNHGTNDNENAVAQDHFLHLPSWITAASVRNTFGVMGDIEPYEVTDVEKTEQAPVKYDLSQNYPNPFNPNTTIQFSIPEAGFVTLKVYDVLGKEVATLLNEEKGSGVYNVSFDASHLPSGTYIYKISAGNFTSTRKMMLLK